MGLTKAAVTYHFRTKEDLLNAVVEPAFTDLNAYLEKWGPGPLKPARRRAAIADYVALLVKHRALLAFLAKDGDRRDPEPVMRQWLRVAKTTTDRALCRAFQSVEGILRQVPGGR